MSDVTDTAPPDDLVERLDRAFNAAAPGEMRGSESSRLKAAILAELHPHYSALRQKLEDAERTKIDLAEYLDKVTDVAAREVAACTLAQSQRDALAKAAEMVAQWRLRHTRRANRNVALGDGS